MCALSKALSVRPDRRSSLWVWLSRVYQQTWVEWCDLLQVVFLELGDSDQSWRLLFEMLILPAYSLAQCVGPSEGAWTAGQSQQYRLWSLKSTLRYVCFWSKYCPKDLCASLCQRNTCIWVPIKTVWGDSSVRKVPVLQVWRSEFESQYPMWKARYSNSEADRQENPWGWLSSCGSQEVPVHDPRLLHEGNSILVLLLFSKTKNWKSWRSFQQDQRLQG